jgi:hypothetical protein
VFECGDIVIGDFDDMGTATGFDVDGAKVCGRIVGEAVVGLPVGDFVLTGYLVIRSFKSYVRTDRVASLNVA